MDLQDALAPLRKAGMTDLADDLQALLVGPRAVAWMQGVTERLADYASSMTGHTNTDGERPEYGHTTYDNSPDNPPVGAVGTDNMASVVDDAAHSTLLKLLGNIR